MDKLLNESQKKDVGHLICRAVLGHRWNPDRGNVAIDGGKYYWKVPCDGCGTERTIVIAGDGYRDGNSYKYPDGYTFEGFGFLDKHDLAKLRVFVLIQLGAG